MVKRVQYMSMLCVGSLIVSTTQANEIQEITRGSAQSSNSGLPSAINQDLMNIVAQVMYGKTTGQVIDELVYTYGAGNSVASLSSIAQLLSGQLGYLTLAVTSAQAIVAILPPTSPHLVAAKLMINELSMFITCVQTVLAQVQQNAQAPAPVAASVSATGTTPTPTATPAPAAGLASAAVALFSDVASAIAASHAASSSNAPASSQTAQSSATASGTHHHGHGW